MSFVFVLFAMFISGPLVLIDFLVFLTEKRNILSGGLLTLIESLTLIVYPLIYLWTSDFDMGNDCCSQSAFFSPTHRLTLYIIITICVIAYFYSKFRSNLAPPLLEVFVNAVLVGAVVLNIFLIAHGSEGWAFWLVGSGAIIILYFYQMLYNHKQILAAFQEDRSASGQSLNSIAHFILMQPLYKKAPLLFLFCLPVLLLLASVLLLFGQQPDSFIRAFTDTYNHGLSSLDCSNVTCPEGHFLCTIAASGHVAFVKPLRMGIRQNVAIKVNRQLLVSNAFEDLLAERLPFFHKPIRNMYNVIGGNCKKLYDALENKWLADAVYLVMKPLEWFFLFNLYLFDCKPENRIAKQYLHAHHRNLIDKRRTA